ncbi:DUF948 domain-containing protein [Romboutsia sp.]|uniref:DUF948 domain-containing protein n=1 Tax=Romboutsia sp. TaxID=1965302 RepID=UPI003F2E9091
MDALGWQIGAVLIGSSTLIVAIYVSKLLHSTTKVVEKTNKIIDYNERHIHEIIENAASITKEAEEIMDVVNKLTSLTRVFRFMKR